MRIFRLHPRIHTLNKLIAPEENLSTAQKKLKDKIQRCHILRQQKVPWNVIAELENISRSSYYRLKKAVALRGIKGAIRSKKPKKTRAKTVVLTILPKVLEIRLANPTYGKEKIGAILRRDHSISASDSSVGRAIKILKAQGKIHKSISAVKIKRKRVFDKHAKPWKYGMKAEIPGAMVQVDHMTISKNNVTIKHFAAWDKCSKYLFATAFSRATANCARKFLRQIIKISPFKIKAIQVDGGSEFMAQFEEECQKLNIQLFVLPPRKPQYNGGVERSNRTCREEFYANPKLCSQDSISGINLQLHNFIQHYNNYRPHKTLKPDKKLDPITPTQYILNHEANSKQSHIY